MFPCFIFIVFSCFLFGYKKRGNRTIDTNQKTDVMSDLMLDNVEALANDEIAFQILLSYQHFLLI
ncbi:NVEALA domain-containing protein [uncultured Bacteroides sp.]|uniref:NVEALA domain-containing protein n=1 Tax=uncultured Bacteroides sp. TaxID=162156 RepID=UPI003433A939